MVNLNFFLIIFFIPICYSESLDETVHKQPEQIHLSFGAEKSEMIVTWVTFNMTRESTVRYGMNRFAFEAYGTAFKFIDGGTEMRELFIHRVTITELKPGRSYIYHCGSDDGWSSIFTFTTLQRGSDWSPKLAVYGDLGNVNGRSLGRLQTEVQNGLYDAILHLGDMAYDLHDDNGRKGDEFMRQIEPMAAYVPYQVIPGNHEYMYNFSNYNNRFSMVSKGSDEFNNFFWSYDIGPAHIIAFSTEFIFNQQFGTIQIENQYKWLEQDLIKANKPKNRAKRPWIITLGHRPIYLNVTVPNNPIRLGYIPKNQTKLKYGVEDLFYKYGVDLELWGHLHIYERLWPIYNLRIYNGSLKEPYKNPKAPVHITTGSAGCLNHYPSLGNQYWSAFSAFDYGYTRMTLNNFTHLCIEQVSEDKDGEIIDKFCIIKRKHGPYA